MVRESGLAPSTTTRRALLAGSLGALVAHAAQTLARPLATRAANGDTMTAGHTFTASATTGVSTTSGHGLQGTSSEAYATGVYGENSSEYGYGVAGRNTSQGGTGVWGDSSSGKGVGVYGSTGESMAVRGVAGSGYGVYATAGTGTGVYGSSYNNTGILGYSGSAFPPAALANTGIYGYADSDASARGVTGQSTAGVGLYGLATTGYALRTDGRIKLDKSSGSTTITAGSKSKTITPGVDVTTSSVLLATLQGSAGGTTTVHRAAINATANTFTIYLTAKATVNVKVGWILLS